MSNFTSEELEALQLDISEGLKVPVTEITVLGRDELRRVLQASLEDGTTVTIHVAAPGIPTSSLQSEVATLDHLRTRTSMPVPRIKYTNYARTAHLRPYIILEKPDGESLDDIWTDLADFQKDLIVGQIARWIMEAFRLRFDRIGSLYPLAEQPGEVIVGAILKPSFYIDGRAEYPLDRGPFSSAKAYLSACAQRELDCCRFMFSQDTSAVYQLKLEEEKINVERSMSLFQRLIEQCEGLDELDPEMAPFSIDIHELGPKHLTVAMDDQTHVISVNLPVATTQPLWCCATLPPWLTPSMSGQYEADKARLAGVFRQTVTGIEGYHSLFLRGLETQDTRHALEDVCRYDAFKDSFLLTPALQSIAATLPGDEDLEGLKALLDPSTLEGRVARITLMTRGSGTMSLAMPIEPELSHTNQGDTTLTSGTNNSMASTEGLKAIRLPRSRLISGNGMIRAASASVTRKVSNDSLSGAGDRSFVSSVAGLTLLSPLQGALPDIAAVPGMPDAYYAEKGKADSLKPELSFDVSGEQGCKPGVTKGEKEGLDPRAEA